MARNADWLWTVLVIAIVLAALGRSGLAQAVQYFFQILATIAAPAIVIALALTKVIKRR